MADVIERLVAQGLGAAEAARKARLFAETARVALAQPGGDGTLRQWFVPGRIEVLGKHTDYAGGRSLLCAVERGFCVSASPRSDAILRVIDVPNGVDAQFVVSEDQPPDTRWRNYPATVARRVARNFPPFPSQSSSMPQPQSLPLPLRGANIAFASDLPRSAGLSSSTTLIIAIFTVLTEVNALERHPAFVENIPSREALAAYLGCVENGRTFGTLTGDAGVGTKGGSQDHTAVLCSEAGQIVGYAYSPARRERVLPVPAGYTFAVGASGVAAEKTGDARDDYNRAAAAVAALLDLWHEATGRQDATLYDAIAPGSGSGSGAEFDTVAVARLQEIVARMPHPDFTPDALTARLDQFVLEAFQIIPRASDMLALGDVAAFGDLVDRSQAAAELWLGNQIPETIALARLARTLGAGAASAFGAGFGGSVWALIKTGEAPAFLDAWKSRYLASFPARADRADFFLTGAGPALFQL
jgi:galactokinase